MPSSGSTIQRRPLVPSLRAPSSASRPSSGRSAASSSSIARSASRSASDTGSVRLDLVSSPSGRPAEVGEQHLAGPPRGALGQLEVGVQKTARSSSTSPTTTADGHRT